MENGQNIWTDISLMCVPMARKHMKGSSTSLATKEIQIKTIMKHHYTNIYNTYAGEDVKKLNHSIHS